MSNNFSNLPSVTDLAALKKLWPDHNTLLVSVWLQGLSAYNSGSGVFTWNSSSNAVADDITVINPTGNSGNGRWLSNSSLTGNTVTTPVTTGASVGVYYMGSTRFAHMYTDPTLSDEYNTFYGYQAGNFTMGTGGSPGVLGARNTGIGYQALALNTTGWQNTAVGYWSQRKTTTGIYNTSVGAWSLIELTTGSNNTCVGSDSGWKITTGNNNTGVGSYSLQQNITGTDNTAVGKDALRYNSTGNNNTAIGSQSMKSVGDDTYGSVTGSQNTAVGFQSLLNITSGVTNTAVGAFTLTAITTQGDNTVVGNGAGQGTTGSGNTLLGSGAADDMTTGSSNVVIGYQTGTSISTGSTNTLIGPQAATSLTTGSNNIIIGNVDADSATGSNQLNIGNLLKGSTATSGSRAAYCAVGGTPIIIGATLGGYPTVGFNAVPSTTLNSWQYLTSDFATFIRYDSTIQTYTAASGTAGNTITTTQGPYVANGATSWTTPSDNRLKDNFRPIVGVLDKISSLTPGSYEWSGEGSTPKDGKTEIGLRAQEVHSVFPEIVDKGDDGDIWIEGVSQKWGVREDKYGVISLAAVKELLLKVESLEQRVNELEAINA